MPSEQKTYKVEIKRTAFKALQKLPNDIKGRLQTAIDGLAANPRPNGYKQLQSKELLYRIRVGDWRIIYTIFDDTAIVLIVEIGSRGGIYRHY